MMNKPTPFSQISLYRDELMGIAILWIIFYHAAITMSHLPLLFPITFLKQSGYGGADIFFFISGFSLFAGWHQNRYTVVKFYKQRFLRIMPTYWIVVALYFLIRYFIDGNVSIAEIAAMATGFNFYLNLQNVLTFWFVPAILVCYALFPFMVGLLEQKKKFSTTACIVMAVCFLALSFLATVSKFYYLLILLIRLVVFLSGIYAGYLFVTKDNMSPFKSTKLNAALLCVGLLFLYLIIYFTSSYTLWRYGLWWYPFLLITFPLCLFISGALVSLERDFSANSVLALFRKSLAFCGRYSLEIYLIHVTIFLLFPHLIGKYLFIPAQHPFNTTRIPEYTVYTIMALGLAPLLHKLTFFRRSSAQTIIKKQFLR